MEKSVYNLDKIIKIEILEKRESNRFRYQEAESYLFGLIKFKGGFCPIQVVATSETYSKEQLEAGEYPYSNQKYVVEDYKVYCKPRVVIHFSNDYILNIDFDTNEEAHKRLEEIVDKSIPNLLVSIQ